MWTIFNNYWRKWNWFTAKEKGQYPNKKTALEKLINRHGETNERTSLLADKSLEISDTLKEKWLKFVRYNSNIKYTYLMSHIRKEDTRMESLHIETISLFSLFGKAWKS